MYFDNEIGKTAKSGVESNWLPSDSNASPFNEQQNGFWRSPKFLMPLFSRIYTIVVSSTVKHNRTLLSDKDFSQFSCWHILCYRNAFFENKILSLASWFSSRLLSARTIALTARGTNPEISRAYLRALKKFIKIIQSIFRCFIMSIIVPCVACAPKKFQRRISAVLCSDPVFLESGINIWETEEKLQHIRISKVSKIRAFQSFRDIQKFDIHDIDGCGNKWLHRE